MINVEKSETVNESDFQESTINDNHPITVLPRVSLWLSFLLTFFTLWIYPVYWFFTRAQKINRKTKHKISIPLIILYMLIWLAYNTSAYFLPSSVNEQVGLYFSLSFLIAHGVVIYFFVDRVSQLLFASKISFHNVNGLLCFVFSPFYMQMKINQALDEVDEKHNKQSQ